MVTKKEDIEYFEKLGFTQVENDIKMIKPIGKLLVVFDWVDEEILLATHDWGTDGTTIFKKPFNKYDLEEFIEMLEYQISDEE